MADTIIKIVLSIIARRNLKWKQADIVGAYLDALIGDRQVFMKAPTGFADDTDVCMLHKALFGLRQSANLRHKKFHKDIIDIGWKPIEEDLCVFIEMILIRMLFNPHDIRG